MERTATGGGYLHSLPPEHSRTVYFNQANYGPVSGRKMDIGAKGGNKMVVTGGFGVGGDTDGGPGGGTDGGGRG